MNTIQISAEKRAGSGKKAAKATRAAGLIPAIIYGGGTETQIAVKHNDVRAIIFTNEFLVAEVTVDGESHKCFVKEVQMHPVTDEIVHIDFIRLIDSVPVKISLPIVFTGNPVGVKDGGAFLQQVRKIRIKTLPKNIIPALTVDISNLGLGQAIKVKDLAVEEGVQILEEPATPIGQVIVPRALKSVMGEGEGGEEMVDDAAAPEAAAE